MTFFSWRTPAGPFHSKLLFTGIAALLPLVAATPGCAAASSGDDEVASTSAGSAATVSDAVLGGDTTEDSFTLILRPREKPIPYESPAVMALAIKDGVVGHTMEELRCQKSEKRPDGFYLLTGQTGGAEMTDDVQKRGYGLGIIWKSYEGYLQDEKRVRDNVTDKAKTGAVSFVRYRISASMCERLASFVEEYKDKKYFNGYGLVTQPRKREGGGCTGFGMGFLEVAGFVESEYETAWRKTLNVQASLIGDPDKGKKVTVFDLATSFRWARQGEAQKAATYWEPNFIHAWIVDRATKLAAGDNEIVKGARPVTFAKAKGLEFDKRDVEAPNDPIYLVDP